MMLTCEYDLLRSTIEELQNSSAGRVESMALWLASNSNRDRVTMLYVPEYRSKADMFQITPAGMRDLRQTLREQRVHICAQLHTHPFDAFHSKADDYWAIIRHEGSLSIVLPNFARDTTTDDFLTQAAVFEMSPENRWLQLSPLEISNRLAFSKRDG